ncbi:MlaD family protein [Nitriliruptor alkaliphilus]|uniref:MlaD family protein n=1 Tax=Nitriliruptor alkaliphilus TaxID=427918 RepID=UPI000695DC34|nr:MlaD family protein [Nitriliruptor alkaliphilus]
MKALSAARSRLAAVPGFGRNVAVIVGAALLGLVTLTSILSSQQVIWPWQDRYVFQATFAETPGIAPGQGQEVRIAGVPSGWITDATVDERGRAVLTLSLDAEQGPVHRDARVVLRPKSPLNEMYVELDPGNSAAGTLAAGEALPIGRSARPIQIEEPLTHLDADVRTALRTLLAEADIALADAGAELPEGIDRAASTVEGLEPVVAALDRRSDLLRSLITDLGDVGTAIGGDEERLGRLIRSAEQTMRTLASSDDDLRATLEQLPGVSDALQRGATSVSDLTDALDPTLRDVAEATDRLPGTLEQVDTLIERADRTVDLLGPVVDQARPLLSDLRPLADDVRTGVEDLSRISPQLDPLTATAAARMGEFLPFIYNTQSLTSTQDAHGPIFRGLVAIDLSSVSTGVPEIDRLLAELPVGTEERG